MLVIDANVILRIILNDNETMVNKAIGVIKSGQILIKNEVLAEVVYVLAKVYNVTKFEICESILRFIDVKNINTESKDIIVCAVHTFQNNNLDFVDCLIYAYHAVGKLDIFTFDKRLNALLSK